MRRPKQAAPGPRPLRVGSHNVRGLRKRVPHLGCSRLHALLSCWERQHLDVVCLQETHVLDSDIDLVTADLAAAAQRLHAREWTAWWAPAQKPEGRRVTGGTAILIRSSLLQQGAMVLTGGAAAVSVADGAWAGRGVSLQLQWGGHTFTLTSAYFPLASTAQQAFIREWVGLRASGSGEHLLAADFNFVADVALDTVTGRARSDGPAAAALAAACPGLIDVLRRRHPARRVCTFFHPHGASRLDRILCSGGLEPQVLECGVAAGVPSDHMLVTVALAASPGRLRPGKRASGAAEQGTGDGGSVATAAATGALAGTGASATVAAGGTAGGPLPALAEAMKAALTEMGVLPALMQMQGVLPPLMQTVSMIAQLQLTRFDYTSSKASSSRHGDGFKDRLQAFYDNNTDAPALHATPRQHLRCMLLNVKLPKTLVTAVHIFKHCWKADFRVVLGLTDINDARNGLLLFKPLEHAFDDSRICFTSVEEAGEIQFKMKLLDSKLEEIKVWDYAAEHNLCKGYGASQIDDYAATVTFGELQNKPLVFTNNNRPYKRCLRFQGLQAVRRADASNWLPKGGSPPQDMFCNSEEAKRLDVWLTMAAQAPPPPDADESSNAGD